MADFKQAFEKTLMNEGGYKLTNIEGDTGGLTFAGISKVKYPNWMGWKIIDVLLASVLNPVWKNGILADPRIIFSDELKSTTMAFYKSNFWDAIKGDLIKEQEIAYHIYDFGVNAGISTSIKIVKSMLQIKPIDTSMDDGTIKEINIENTRVFITTFCLFIISRYTGICNKNKTMSKFLLGWINRALMGVI